MPELKRVLTEDDLQRRSYGVKLDLSAYLEIIDAVTGAGGSEAIVQLGPDERQRTEKRRLSMAATQRGYRLVWRRSDCGSLRFVLVALGAPVSTDQKRRAPAASPGGGDRGKR